MRRSYVDLQEGKEAYYSQSLADDFNSEIRNLEESNTWKVVSRQTFPAYCCDEGIFSDGIVLVCKVGSV